ncbi:enoyl-CoA hydratase-related protein [Pseudogracilibacillus sp. SO30301A]|uniref:enoyl-CoA hydratase-related protein n=1 Tax=Pseudogracilibacillus sp. SO30301A TaxID=3098291 RepID=UPI00300E5CA3
MEITLDRPKVNAIHTGVSNELGEIFKEFNDDDSLRVAIITGGGDKFFSVGWDLKAGEAVDANHGPGGFAGLTEMHHLHKPVIAAVNGLAVGGGFELALACDLIIATDHAEFFLPETTIGIIPDSGGVLHLPKRLPRAIALEMMYTGMRLSAERAYHFGLVNKIVPLEKLLDEAWMLAKKIVESAPLSIAAVKEVLKHTEHQSIEEGYRTMRSDALTFYPKMLKSNDANEGMASFAENRNPIWKGN